MDSPQNLGVTSDHVVKRMITLSSGVSALTAGMVSRRCLPANIDTNAEQHNANLQTLDSFPKQCSRIVMQNIKIKRELEEQPRSYLSRCQRKRRRQSRMSLCIPHKGVRRLSELSVRLVHVENLLAHSQRQLTTDQLSSKMWPSVRRFAVSIAI